MKFAFLVQKFGIILFLASLGVFAQKASIRDPKQEKLLNGLKVLMWSDPSADKVAVKIRVHSGSAFDPQGKEGLMKLLSEAIFPNSEAHDFFREDLGGGLDIVSNYDYIQINASAKPSAFVTMLETLSNAVTNPTIDKETTEKLKSELMLQIAEAEKDPRYLADRAATKRLFGTFPYGRPMLGTAESVRKIDFADLRFARERFFGADNATVAISGNFDADLAFRAVRRYFGSWLKSDNKVPSTFRQPDDPDTKMVAITAASIGDPVLRFAFRGVSRSDKDYAASLILGRIWQTRLRSAGSNVTVASEARILPGVVLIGFNNSTATSLPTSVLSNAVTPAEFASAKSELSAEASKKLIDEFWLDADTYKTTPADDIQAFQNVSVGDVQRVADRLAKNPIVSVAVLPSAREGVK